MATTNDTRLTRRALVVRAGATAVALAAAQATPGLAAVRRFPGAGAFDADVPTAWFDLARELVQRTPGYSPPVAARALGYAGLTLYEAVVPGMDGYRSLAGASLERRGVSGLPHDAAYDWRLVANAALAEILRQLFPTAPSALKEQLEALEASFVDGFRSGLAPGAGERSIQRGRSVADAVFAWSATDGGHEGYARNFPAYTPPTGQGLWVPTPPAFSPALQPYWGGNRCLAIGGGADCPPGEHPPYSEAAGSAFHDEALEVFETDATLTPEQEAIARFWSDDPGQTPTPPGHSISIATQVLRREDATLAAAAETYAKVGIAVCDAFVACWHAKYAYNLLRPVTYLRELADPVWLPLLGTPPFPEYPSGHSVQSAAAFAVLTDLFGPGYAFVDNTHDARDLEPRSFGSFEEAGAEAAISRLYGGIHFRAAIERGLEQGRCIGEAVTALPLRE
jgi:hypothetical protein